MNRRNFLQSLGAALVALPFISLTKTQRDRIYLRHGDVLQGCTFTKDVEVWAEGDATVMNCRFERATLHLLGPNGAEETKGRFIIRDCAFIGETSQGRYANAYEAYWQTFNNEGLVNAA